MKIRDSGMPVEETWAEFFDPLTTFQQLRLTASTRHVVEFGCGYGTFTIPAAQTISGTLYSLEIEPQMIDHTKGRVDAMGLTNVELIERDFLTDGSGLEDGKADYVMLFNILHPLRPIELLEEARRNLREGGVLGIIHWNYDSATPRGPDMEFRPRPAQVIQWVEEAGFEQTADGIVDLPPYHYGIAVRKPTA